MSDNSSRRTEESVEDKEARRRFIRAHRLLANRGMCDGTGGMEYCRVFREWNDEGRPEDVVTFIYENSNCVDITEKMQIRLNRIRAKLDSKPV